MQITRERYEAVLAVLHDLNLAGSFADRVMVMSQGEVVAVGRPEEVLCPDLLSKVFNHQVMVMPIPRRASPSYWRRSKERQLAFPLGSPGNQIRKELERRKP